MVNRSKTLEFQSRLIGLKLSHGTRPESTTSILRDGLVGEYVYACIDEGWEMHEQTSYIEFLADSLIDRIFPDPEGQWGWFGEGHSMKKYVDEHGMEATLDELERCFNEEMEGGFEDVTDPRNYNLVIVGPVEPSILFVRK